MKDTINPERYSILPWPNGCSLSAGFAANLNPSKVINEEAASERLLKASAVTEILLVIIPIINLTIKSILLITMPTILPKKP
jgi:hypothetical protein